MRLKTFFENIFVKQNTIKDILDLYPDSQEKGKKFERCADLIIKLGLLPIFPNNKHKHVIGNVNEGKFTFLNDFKQYIDKETVNSGNKTGISDITLYNESEDKYIFISSKCFKNESTVNNYDIQGIKAMIDHNKHIFKNTEIFLLVNDKIELIDKVSKSHESSNYISKFMDKKHIIDLNDLEYAFLNLKNYLIKDKNIFKNFVLNKKILEYKFHQRLFVSKILKQKKLNKKTFLLGCKPRTGKTYIVGSLISEDKQNYEKFNILIITPAPNETSSQFLEMFESYIDFNDFNIINFNTGSMKDKLFFCKKNIIITSKQLLQNYIKDDHIKSIKLLKLDYMFFDENHFGGTTQLSTDIVNSYKCDNTHLVLLTATYQKPLNHWLISTDCSYYWDLEDEKMCKNNDLDGLIIKHGDEVLETFNYFKNPDILKNYEKMPELELITSMFETDIFKMIKDKAVNNKYGFSLKTLFSLTNSKFNYENEVELLLRYISGSNKEIDFSDGDKSIFGRIKEISLKKNSRTLLSNTNFSTQLWFLPFGIEQKINDVSENLKKLMENNNVLKKFEILILNSTIEKPIKDIKQEIKKQEIKSKYEGKTGLIILVGNQCSLGITLENCDVVILLNDILSSDKIYQMMYRSMTEAQNKKCGFVIDLNINRVLNTVMEYSLNNKDITIENKIKYIVENNLIHIDSDYFMNKQIDEEILIKNLLDIWKKDPINQLRRILKNIENDIIEVNNEDQKKLNNYFSKSFETPQKKEPEDPKEDPQELSSGQTIKKIKESNDTESDTDDDEKISLTKDVLPFILPFICYLTIKDNNKNVLDMLLIIQQNDELLEIFNDQTFIWWNKNNMLDLINFLIKKYIRENSDIYDSTILIKMKLQSLIDQPVELLKFIHDCLKPKELEKKKFGEVFTPMPLINEMLDKLPIEVWENPELKWLDPANGMGNFMITVYFRLFKGLKDIIIDDKLRKKHILENMLYMSEINKKNCFISKQIFDINNKYKLNIYNGDSLLLNTFSVWNIEKFDIIVGNPPYQAVSESGIVKGGGNNLYTKFIYKSDSLLKDNGFLLYITPPTFFSIGRSNNKDDMNIRKDIFNNYFIHYINLEECSKYFNVGSKFIYYLIQKKNEINQNIKVICKYNKNIYESIINQELFNSADFLPYLLTNESLSICDKIKLMGNKIDLFHSPDNRSDKKHVGGEKDNEHKYPIQATGKKIVYSSKECKNQTDKKILMSRSGYLNPFYDDGINGVGGDCFCILVKNKIEADYLIKLINSNLYKFYIETNKWSGFHHMDVLKYLSYIKLNDNFIDNDLYKIFNLSENEIKLINDIYNNDNTSLSSKSTTKSTTKSSKSTKLSANEHILCGAPLKKKDETCKNKANPDCNGRCKRHYVIVI